MGSCVSAVRIEPIIINNESPGRPKYKSAINIIETCEIDLQYLLSSQTKALSDNFILYLAGNYELFYLHIFLELKTLNIHQPSNILTNEYKRIYHEYIISNHIGLSNLEHDINRSPNQQCELLAIKREIYTVLADEIEKFRRSAYFQDFLRKPQILPTSRGTSSSTQMRKVLLCTDNSLFSDVFRKQLRESNNHVDFVTNGFDALIKLKKMKYDLVLLNLNLKGKNGLVVLEEYLVHHTKKNKKMFMIDYQKEVGKKKNITTVTLDKPYFLAMLMTDDEYSRDAAKHCGFYGVLRFPKIGIAEMEELLPVFQPKRRKTSIFRTSISFNMSSRASYQQIKFK